MGGTRVGAVAYTGVGSRPVGRFQQLSQFTAELIPEIMAQ